MEHTIGYLFKAITDKLKAKAAADLKSHGISFTQIQLLGYLFEHNGRATQKELELFLKVSHPTVVGVITRLEKNGFVTTWFDPDDKRVKNVEHTEKALQLRNKLDESRNSVNEIMLNKLTEAEQAELQRLLSIIYSNLE